MNTCAVCGAALVLLVDLQKNRIYRCIKCRSGMRWPFETTESSAEYYRSQYYGEDSRKLSFDTARLPVYKRDFARCPGNRHPGTLLDFGCGLGHFLAWAEKSGWEITGLEISEQAREIANRSLGKDAVVSDLNQLIKNGCCFDSITAWNVLDHIPDPAQTLRQLRSVLNGTIVIRITNFTPRIFLLKTGMLFKIRFLTENFKFFKDVNFTPGSIKFLLKQCGYSDVRVKNSSIAGDIEGGGKTRLLNYLTAVVSECIYLLSLGTLCVAPSLLISAQSKTDPCSSLPG